MEDKLETPEIIGQDIQNTRDSLTDKVAMLEQTVVGTLQTATDAVQDTVTTVKSAVQDSVDAVKDSVTDSVTSVTDSVKETLDLANHVRNHPWQMVGGAAFAGLAAGWLFFGRSAGAATAAITPSRQREIEPPTRPAAPAPQAPREPGVVDAMLGKAGQEIQDLVQTTMDTTFSALREQVREQWPKLVATLLTAATDRVAESTSLGVPERSPRFGNHRVASTLG